MWQQQTTESRQQAPGDASRIYVAEGYAPVVPHSLLTFDVFVRTCISARSNVPLAYIYLFLWVSRARGAPDKRQPNTAQQQQQPQRPRCPLEAARLVRSSAYMVQHTNRSWWRRTNKTSSKHRYYPAVQLILVSCLRLYFYSSRLAFRMYETGNAFQSVSEVLHSSR